MVRTTHQGKSGIFISEEELLSLGLMLIDVPPPPQNSPQLLVLKYFTIFNTVQKQEALRNAIKKILSRIDVNAGRDWIVIYVAFCFYTGNQKLTKRYADFFHDIDLLLPDLLNNVCHDGKTNSQRYRKYTQMLSIECSFWFVLNSCLPPLSEWTSRQYVYHVDQNRQRLIQSVVIDVLKCLQS